MDVLDLFAEGKRIYRLEDMREGLTKALSPIIERLKPQDIVQICGANEMRSAFDYALLLSGARTTGKYISLPYNPHRLAVKCGNQPTVYDALHKRNFDSNLARISLHVMAANAPPASTFLHDLEIGVAGLQIASDFLPSLARNLCDRYKLGPSSRVLDPCAGWGGRMLGISCVVDHYTACEPSTATHAGLKRILEEVIEPFRPEFDALILNAPFEDVELPAASFDFALTSPPYFDTEQYADEPTQSFKRYSSFDDWVTGFYRPLIVNTLAALKQGAPFILNVGSRTYPLHDTLMMIAQEEKLAVAVLDYTTLGGGRGNNNAEEIIGETFYEIRRPV